MRRLRPGDPPRYELEVQPELRRLERRKARRVQVEPDDGVRAELRLEGHAAPLAATLADLSADGCRLTLAAPDARAAEVAPGTELEVALTLPDGGAARHSRLLLLRLERADERVQEYGAAWVAPDDAFTDCIARFVAIKQHALQHRRAAR